MMDEVATSPFAGSLDAVTTLFAELGEELRSTEGKSAFAAVTRTAVRRVEGATAASITTLRPAGSRRWAPPTSWRPAS